MDRHEDSIRFLREDIAGTVAATVANFSMGRGSKPLRPSDFFGYGEAKKPRINRKRIMANMDRMFRVIGQRVGLIVKDAAGNIIEEIKPSVN